MLRCVLCKQCHWSWLPEYLRRKHSARLLHQHSLICEPCLHSLPWMKTGCLRCGMPLPKIQLSCGVCIKEKPLRQFTQSAFYYEPPITELIKKFKFQNDFVTLKALSLCLAHHIKKQQKQIPIPDFLIPIPLHPEKLRQRGFNQSQQISRILSKQLGIPTTDLLIRTKDTLAQSKQSGRSRRQQLKDAFAINKKNIGSKKTSLPPKLLTENDFQHVAIIDDVITTGSTAESATKCLLKHGINTVSVWTIASANSL